MNVVPQLLVPQMMDHRVNPTVYVVVLSEPVNSPLSVSPIARKWEATRGIAKCLTLRENEPSIS